VRITDRLKDMYIVGGFNAYPAEIEAVLGEHPAVALVAVIGVPDPRLGEVGAAFVVIEDGSTLSEADLVDWSRDRMSNYKVPREVHFVETLPMTATMKVAKADLRRLRAEAK
jgi:acyl-CoA synthetase (AMP-forming)/AMP-acid ligase II